MALNSTGGSNTIFLSISDGALTRTFKEANQNTRERVTKTGRLVHEQHFRDVEGLITGLETRENDYGKQWWLSLEDGDEKYIITMPYSSRYASSFLKALPNLDKSKNVKIMPWSMTDKQDASKKVTGVTMYQDGIKVLPAYTKDEPNGLPQMKQVKIKGKITWDDSDMMEFLEKAAMSWLNDNSEAAPF
jgi:hypothetical protein